MAQLCVQGCHAQLCFTHTGQPSLLLSTLPACLLYAGPPAAAAAGAAQDAPAGERLGVSTSWQLALSWGAVPVLCRILASGLLLWQPPVHARARLAA